MSGDHSTHGRAPTSQCSFGFTVASSTAERRLLRMMAVLSRARGSCSSARTIDSRDPASFPTQRSSPRTRRWSGISPTWTRSRRCNGCSRTSKRLVETQGASRSSVNSHGGASVLRHLASPGSHGLFHQAIVMSGGSRRGPLTPPVEEFFRAGTVASVPMIIGTDMPRDEPARLVARTVTARGQRAWRYRIAYAAESTQVQSKQRPTVSNSRFSSGRSTRNTATRSRRRTNSSRSHSTRTSRTS